MKYDTAGNTVKGYSSMYTGNKDPFSMKSPFSRGQVFIHGQRSRLNSVAIAIAFFVPWLLFCAVFVVLSFSLHYSQPAVAYILVALCFLVVAYTCVQAVLTCKRKETEPTYQPSWYIFLGLSCVLAFALGCYGGEWNFTNFMQPYYDLNNLAEYTNGIDTNEFLGQQLMDAGRIEFKKGTVLDLGRSMGFKSHDVYCVAPIMTKGSSTSQPLSVDFWAVGKNCCSGVSADFHCAGFSDPHALGAIRMMHDADRPFYRLAVQQAEATYKMTASHPLFFTWVHNADEAVDKYNSKGWLNFVMAVCSYLVLQLFLVLCATLAFAKLVHA